jgi:hypothetical protein
MALADTLTDSVPDALIGGLNDAGDVLVDAVLGSSSSSTGRRRWSAVLMLVLVSAVVGLAIWRRLQADQAGSGRPPSAS